MRWNNTNAFYAFYAFFYLIFVNQYPKFLHFLYIYRRSILFMSPEFHFFNTPEYRALKEFLTKTLAKHCISGIESNGVL